MENAMLCNQKFIYVHKNSLGKHFLKYICVRLKNYANS